MVASGDFAFRHGRIHFRSDVTKFAALILWHSLGQLERKAEGLSEAQKAVFMGELTLALRKTLCEAAREQTGICLENRLPNGNG